MAPDETTGKPLNYVMVHHLGYARDFHLHRAARTGGRHQRFTLDNGRQIRWKGSRYTEVSFDDVFKNFNMLLQGIREGRIAACRPDSLEPFTMEQFVDLGKRLAADFKNDLEINETLLEPLVGSDLTDKQVWVEKPKSEEAPKPQIQAVEPYVEPAAPVAEEPPHVEEAPVEEPEIRKAPRGKSFKQTGRNH